MPASRSLRIRLGAIALGTALAVPPAIAQAPPVLRAATRLVEVSVVVHDKKGQGVADLAAGDFEIWDAGEKQAVAMLRVERTTPPPGEPAPAPLPASTFSNLPVHASGAVNAITVVLVDGLNTPFADQVFARRQLIRVLGALTPADRVALYELGHGLRILHDFTDDPASLLRALDRRGLYSGPKLDDSNPAAATTPDADLNEFLDHANRAVADFQVADRVATTLEAITAIAQHVAGLPGRKNLVWISGGFPFAIGMDAWSPNESRDSRTFAYETERAARAVTAAQLAIYPVDARGLIAGSATSAGTTGGRSTASAGPEAMRDLQQTQDVMDLLAARTGGKAYVNANNLKNAVRGAIDDARVSYVLGYYPTHSAWDGSFRKLTVKVTRPGLNVRHRQGYLALPDEASTEDARRAALVDAARSPVDATALGLSVRIARDVPAPGTLRAHLTIEPGHVSLRQQGDRWVGTIDALFVMQAAADAQTTVTSQAARIDLTQASYKESLKAGVHLAQDLDAAQCRYRLKVVVRDAATGRLGSASARLDTLR